MRDDLLLAAVQMLLRLVVFVTLFGALVAGCGDDLPVRSRAASSTGDTGGPDGGAFECYDLTQLACTGLYGPAGRGWARREPGPGVRPFTPGLQLWSDGAEKSRFIYLPPGARIETYDMDEWTFPVGTKLWKEFSFRGRAIETRFMMKLGPRSWWRTTYRWTEDQSNAFELTRGERHVKGTPGDAYEVPRQSDCDACHDGRRDGVLGFEAISLAHPDARGLTWTVLVDEQLVTRIPDVAPRVPGDAIERAALGWMHVNCGSSCHNHAGGAATWTGLFLRLDAHPLATVWETGSYRTAVGRPASFRPSGSFRVLQRVSPGRPEDSAVFVRAASRQARTQMPPLGTHALDHAGLDLLRTWIVELERRPAPDAGAP